MTVMPNLFAGCLLETTLSYPLLHPRHRGKLRLSFSKEEFAETYPGEGDFVEFKRGFNVRKLQEPVVAFSNADGGVILLGVERDGSVVGAHQPGELARHVYQAISQVVNPGHHDVHHVGVGDKVVLAVAVDRRRELRPDA